MPVMKNVLWVRMTFVGGAHTPNIPAKKQQNASTAPRQTCHMTELYAFFAMTASVIMLTRIRAKNVHPIINQSTDFVHPV